MNASDQPTAGAAGSFTVSLTRVVSAPRPAVFAAWVQKELLDQWCAPAGFTIPSSGGDVRPGGAWHACMRSPDGVDYHVSGKYLEIRPDERLTFTQRWEDDGRETLVTVRFTEHGDETAIAFEESPFPSRELRDSHAEGWSECLDRLETLVATTT